MIVISISTVSQPGFLMLQLIALLYRFNSNTKYLDTKYIVEYILSTEISKLATCVYLYALPHLHADLSLLITSLESERVPTPTDIFVLQANGH